ncbi:MAG: FIG01269488: protein, clustered with ribosomal protein L32p [uncultured Lysobacter sp.]|uniref:Large ribosomal RNA subunit accumulation protein YceD n=1 Tax=uncultured Lysobacter sp. TaxID=271060 RepID=A0A6J4MAT2_9GAMM|nr:MAG: FIG01269488: protein, clustered with ribosomal protein L32p [uncultured Lysobacter sp.]
MVASRRSVEGRVPLAALTRLRDSLVDVEGEAVFAIEFDHDALKVPYAEIRIDAELPLLCQRTLQRFVLPVHIEQRLGLIRSEAEEAGLPPGYEPLLMPEDGMLRTVDLVEDELILAVPVIPIMPGTEAVEQEWPAPDAAPEPEPVNPFAALSALKKDPNS